VLLDGMAEELRQRVQIVTQCDVANLMLFHAPGHERLDARFVNVAHCLASEKFRDTREARRNPPVAVRVCAILRFGPSKERFRRITELAGQDPVGAASLKSTTVLSGETFSGFISGAVDTRVTLPVTSPLVDTGRGKAGGIPLVTREPSPTSYPVLSVIVARVKLHEPRTVPHYFGFRARHPPLAEMMDQDKNCLCWLSGSRVNRRFAC
jgi:hypothetical protein